MEDAISAMPLFEEVLEGVGFSDGLLYEELMKGWNALDADKQEEFKSRLINELRRRQCDIREGRCGEEFFFGDQQDVGSKAHHFSFDDD